MIGHLYRKERDGGSATPYLFLFQYYFTVFAQDQAAQLGELRDAQERESSCEEDAGSKVLFSQHESQEGNWSLSLDTQISEG